MEHRRAESISLGVALAVILAAVTLVALPPPGAGSTNSGSHGSAHATSPSAKACLSIRNDRLRRQCQDSLMPDGHPITSMGSPDLGGGRSAAGRQRSLRAFRGPQGQPDAAFTLVAATGRATIASTDQEVLTFNGVTPGPTLTVRQGDLVEVRLVNRDVARGVTIHWHGVDVPGAEDGVAGVTQDAVLPGDDFVYRFVVPDTGTYWYHSHQFSVDQVAQGLIGALVALPPPGSASEPRGTDVVALAHTYGPALTLNGTDAPTPVQVPSGQVARVRFINTDNGPILASASQEFRVVSIDGSDVHEPTPVAGSYVLIPAGGRADLEVDVGAANVRVGLLAGPTMVLGPDPAAGAPDLSITSRFDPLAYGTPVATDAVRSVSGAPDRTFRYRIGQRTGYLDGKRGNWFTINGRIVPDVPEYVVHRGDIVEWEIANTSLVAHPMHLHGHHWLVMSRNGVPATGSPWWVDSLEINPGERYVLRMVADNPGVWMFHCHNLPHAKSGLMTVMTYDNVRTPFVMGRVRPGLVNQPE